MAGKITYVPAIVAVLTSLLALTNSIPAPDAGSKVCSGGGAFYADASDCNAYIQCANGRGIVQHCQPGLHWNAKANVCDWPENSGCVAVLSRGVVPVPAVEEIVEEEEGGDVENEGAAEEEEEAAPEEEEEAAPEEEEEEAPEEEEEEEGDDDDDDESGDTSKSSGDASTSEESVEGSESSSESVECPEDSNEPNCPAVDPATSVFIPHSDPHWFYHCSNGVAYCKQCPGELVWNVNCDICDWKGQNNCPVTESGNGEEEEEAAPEEEEEEESGDVENEGAAEEEEEEEEAAPEEEEEEEEEEAAPEEEEETGDDESGDTSKSSGDASTSEESVEGSESSSESVECPPDSNEPNCPAVDPATSVFIPHSDPHWFYHCSNGVAYCKQCPGKLVWNENCNTCDYEGQNNCPVTENVNVGEGGGDKSCPPPITGIVCLAVDGLFSFFIPSTDSHYFFHCSNGVAYCKQCPEQLVWNPKCNICDWENKNNCADKESEDSNSSTE